jgi:hypothetical protein
MANPADNKGFSRARLCQLAKVERGKHRRWLALDLLRTKRHYAPADVMRAALLDEINEALKPQATKSIWQSIRDEIGIPGNRLDLVVTLSTLKAQLVRSDPELLASLPRGEEVLIIDLSARAAAVDARVQEHLAVLAELGTASPQPLVDGGSAATR